MFKFIIIFNNLKVISCTSLICSQFEEMMNLEVQLLHGAISYHRSLLTQYKAASNAVIQM